MEEDTDAKIRRNLVVASTLILLIAWLELPLPVVTEKVLSAGTQIHVKPFRMWVACLAVLSYMALRYRFTKEWNLFGRAFHANMRDKREEMINRLIHKAFQRFNSTRQDSGIFTKSLSSVCEEVTAGQKVVAKHLGDQPFSVRSHQRTAQPDAWHGESSFFLEHPTAAANISTGERKVTYAIEGLHKWYVVSTSYSKAVLYSESSVRFIVPVVLCVCAYLTITWQLVKAW